MPELDLGLREIQAVLDSRLDQVAVLREHHQRLLTERDRLHQHGGGVEPSEYGTWTTATQLRPLPGVDLGRVPAHGQDDVPAPGG